EGAEFSILREPGMSFGAGEAARAGHRARDLAGRNAVMFVKEDVRILGPIAIGSEGDEELCLAFLASALLGGAVLGGARKHGKEQRDADKARNTVANLEHADGLLPCNYPYCATAGSGSNHNLPPRVCETTKVVCK